MPPYKLFFTVLLVSFLGVSCGDDENEFNLGGSHVAPQPSGNKGSGNSNATTVLKRLEFPKTSSKNGSFVVVHNALLNSKTGERGVNYSVEWDPEIHAQRWCCYQMYGKTLSGSGTMTGTNAENTTRYTADNDGSCSIYCQYPNDTCIAQQYRFTADPFKNSGYDHGHICPSADRLGSAEANYQTFFLTNMMPQVNSFNAGVWSNMEAKLRDWSKKFDTLYVCKGGTIDRSDYIIKYLGSGQNKIPVPKYFFMALLGKNASGYTAMGFWIEHTGSTPKNSDLKNYMVNIRELEKKTGIDFFCNLSDDIEKWVEELSVPTLQTTWVIK